MCTACVLAAFVVPLGGVALAEVDPVVAVDFADLRGVLVLQAGGTGGTFTANAVSDPGLFSSGRLWRSIDPSAEALFDTGFVGEPNPADASLSFSFGEVRDKRANVSGVARFVDVDGDTVAFLLSGTMSFGPGGNVMAAAVIDGIEVTSDEGLFDGTDGGSVSTADFEDARGSFNVYFTYQFGQTGDGRTHIGVASMNGEASGPRGVPSPSAGALFGVASLAALRRRRRAQIGGSA